MSHFQLLSVAVQLDHSMGDFMDIMTYGSMLVYLFLMYLLTKLIIEKNTHPIAMVKILGFHNTEISRLYLFPVFLAVVISEIVLIPVCNKLLQVVWLLVVRGEMNGWLPYQMHPMSLVYLGLAGTALFFIIALAEYRNISRISMEKALA